jgi:hypothetical protein
MISPTRVISELRLANRLRIDAARAGTDGEGDWHVGIIQRLVATYPSCRYLEVGVRHATCWNRVAPLALVAEGVDIDAGVLDHVVDDDGEVHILSSDDYFRDIAGDKQFEVIFLDGDHRFEQVDKDFTNALGHLASGGTIVLHDTWPGSREETGELACGTVYKLAERLERDPEFNAFTLRRFPGVTLVQRARPDRFGGE